ncbi:MAG: alpha/beta fold hydrolase, partial [Chloroflexi bacterium]|nr:alpha/beta fold hydrolase [Chloroflexota bacterium]
MPFIDVAGNRLYYAESGKRGTPVLFVHGAAANHAVWGAQLRAVGEIARALAVDLPGHGRSAPPGGRTIGAYADSVLRLLDALGLARAVLVGHSMGGAIAQTVALEHADRVTALVLVSTGARLRVLPTILDGILDPDRFESIANLVVDNSYAAGLDVGLRTRALSEFRACPPAIAHGDFTACNAFDILPRLSEIAPPTLVVCGRDDRMTPLKYSEFLAAHLLHARLIVVDRAGHSVMIENPAAVNQVLVDFLKTLDTSNP